jgi:flagellar hook protein FlgE
MYNKIQIDESTTPDSVDESYRLAVNHKTTKMVSNSNGNTKQVAFYSESNMKKPKQSKNGKKNRNRNDTAKIDCYGCGQPGHKRPDCPHKEKWAEYARQKAMQSNGGDQTEENHFTMKCLDEEINLLTAVQEAFASSRGLNKEDIILDNGATVNLFCNRRLLTDLREEKQALKINGISNKIISTRVTGYFHPFGRVYLHPLARVNILSFGQLERKFNIKYHQSIGFSINVQGENYIFKHTKISENGAPLFVLNKNKLNNGYPRGYAFLFVLNKNKLKNE